MYVRETSHWARPHISNLDVSLRATIGEASGACSRLLALDSQRLMLVVVLMARCVQHVSTHQTYLNMLGLISKVNEVTRHGLPVS